MSTGKKLFRPEAMLRYPSELKPSKLRHKYSELRKGRQIPFADATLLLEELKKDVEEKYRKIAGKEFNRYELGEHINIVRKMFWEDSRFLQVFEMLELNPAHAEKTSIPWWNEISASELNHSFDGNSVMVELGPRHSLETQLVRKGIELPIKSISVGGLIETNDGFVVIGLRGGATYSNTYHINAGALRLTESLKSGDSSIYDFYKKGELEAEFGLSESGIKEVNLLSRIFDFAIDNGPMYVFIVKTELDFSQIEKLYEANIDIDKGEHTKLVSIPCDSVMDFIKEHYRGLVENKDNRKDDERYLLHPGALALLSYTKYPLSELENLFREGAR